MSKRKVQRDPSSSGSDDGTGQSKTSSKRGKSKNLSKKSKSKVRASKKELKKNRRSKDSSGSKKRSPSRGSTKVLSDDKDKPTPSIVDKFGFYHSQQPTSTHDGTFRNFDRSNVKKGESQTTCLSAQLRQIKLNTFKSQSIYISLHIFKVSEGGII